MKRTEFITGGEIKRGVDSDLVIAPQIGHSMNGHISGVDPATNRPLVLMRPGWNGRFVDESLKQAVIEFARKNYKNVTVVDNYDRNIVNDPDFNKPMVKRTAGSGSWTSGERDFDTWDDWRD